MSKYVPNSFQVPNAIVDELLISMSPTAVKCYLLIVRKTLGWGKDEDKISLSQFEKFTGAKKSAVGNAVKWLEDMDLIRREFRDGATTNYVINKAPTLPSEREGEQSDPPIETGGGSRSDGRGVPLKREGGPVQMGQQNTLIQNPSLTKPTLTSESERKPAPMLRPDKQKLPGLERFQREVNYAGRLGVCGHKTLQTCWQEIDGEEHVDQIITNINLHLEACTWKNKDDYKTPINHILENRLWLHPPEVDEAEQRRQKRAARKEEIRKQIEAEELAR